MSRVGSVTLAAVPWAFALFGAPLPAAVTGGVSTAKALAEAVAARDRKLQKFVAKAAENFNDQCAHEAGNLNSLEREQVERRLGELLTAADRQAMLGAALFGPDEFERRLLSSDAVDGFDEDGRGYLVALCGHVHHLVLSFAQTTPVLAASTTSALRFLRDELASRPTLDQVQLQIRRAVKAQIDDRRIIVGSRPQLAATFVARDEMLGLKAALGKTGVATVTALHGMRGAGKSQLAASYARECEHDLWRFVGWVTASSREQAINELAAAAYATSLSTAETPADAAQGLITWLNSVGPEPRLLVFDNVSAAADLKDLVPRGPGMQVIVTTTRKMTALGEPVEIGVYTPEQAVDYLQAATLLEDDEGATEVAEALGRLPVALAQAAVLMKLRHYSFDRYHRLLSSADRLDRAVESEDGAYDQPVGVALSLAYKEVLKSLAARDAVPGQAAAHILGALSLLAGSGVPRDWLRGLADDEFTVDEAVGCLIEYSILIESEDRRIVSLHRLQAQVIREDHEADGVVKDDIEAACQVLRTAAAEVTSDHLAQREQNREVSAQLASVSDQPHSRDLVADERWLEIVGETLYRSNVLQDPYPAIALAGCLADCERVLGAEHPDTLRSRNNLAGAYASAGDLGRAIPLYEQTLEDRERVLGAEHPSVLTSRNNLAGAYASAGDLGRAIPLYEQTLEDRERVLGADHPDTLSSRNNLAGAYRSAGDLGRAIPLYEQTLEDRERVLGADHPDTLSSRNNLATSYWQMGRRGESLAILEEAAAAAERRFGSAHVVSRQLVENRDAARAMLGDSGHQDDEDRS